MARPANTSVSAARWLVGVIAGVVLSFLLTTLVTQYFEGAIAERANEIVANAMPSVLVLTNVIGDLDRIDFALDQYVAASPPEQPLLRATVLDEERDVDARIASYTLLPAFPHESELATHMRAGLQDLDSHIERAMSDTTGKSLTELHRKIDAVEQSLRGIVEFDATQGQRLGLEIERIRGQTTGLVVLLDTLSVALAVVAAILAVRQLRRAVGTLELARTAGEQREAELARRAEALGQFAGRVAHDILSPLSTTVLSLELARAACEKQAPAQRAVTQGLSAIHSVHTLVDGLLAFSRAGGRPEPGVSTAIAPVIVDLVDGMDLQARQQHITLEVAAMPDGKVACSPGVLTSLLSNLVRNAIRYMGDAPARRVEVRIIDAGERWRFEVEDTGPGIPADEQQRIFEPYVQLARGDGGGIGLGLATVDRLVRAHGGSLGVRSVPGRGCLFWFELPKSVDPCERSRPAIEPRPEA